MATSKDHPSLQYSELSEKTGLDRVELTELIWESLDEHDAMFVVPYTPNRWSSANSNAKLHIWKGFPDEPCPVEPFESWEEDATPCRGYGSYRNIWKFKPVSCYPVDYKDICTYCLDHWYRKYYVPQHEHDFNLL